MPSVVLLSKNTQNFEIGIPTDLNDGSGPELVCASSDIVLNRNCAPEIKFAPDMSVPAIQTEMPDAGPAWITLAVSTCALLLLCVWAVSNPDKLFAHKFATASSMSANGPDQQAVQEQDRQPQLTEPSQAMQTFAMQEAARLRLAADKMAADKLASDEAATELLAVDRQAVPAPQADKLALEKAAAVELAAQKLVAENLAVEQAAEQKLATAELAAKLSAEKLSAEKLATEKLAAETLAAERLAEQKVAAEALAAEKLAAEVLAAENLAAQKLAADALAAEKLAAEKLAAEAVAAEALAAEKLAAEKLAAETLAAEKLAAETLAADALAAEKVAADALAATQKIEAERLAEEKRAADARLAAEKQQAEQLAATPNRSIPLVDGLVPLPNKVTGNETPFERSRRAELATLSGLSAQIRFELNGIDPLKSAKQSMDRVFELLFLYSETEVTVQVASNEYEIDNNNQLISRERALTVVNYLIDRGLDEQRFKIRALGKQRLPFDSHRVTVIATVIDK